MCNGWWPPCPPPWEYPKGGGGEYTLVPSHVHPQLQTCDPLGSGAQRQPLPNHHQLVMDVRRRLRCLDSHAFAAGVRDPEIPAKQCGLHVQIAEVRQLSVAEIKIKSGLWFDADGQPCPFGRLELKGTMRWRVHREISLHIIQRQTTLCPVLPTVSLPPRVHVVHTNQLPPPPPRFPSHKGRASSSSRHTNRPSKCRSTQSIACANTSNADNRAAQPNGCCRKTPPRH